MVTLIYGSKGSGKTGKIIKAANAEAEKGIENIVFLTDTLRYQYDINRNIRMYDVLDYDIATQLGLLGFIRGILASNRDIKLMYIDGAHRMTNEKIPNMEYFYKGIKSISEKQGVDFVLTLSTDELPEFVASCNTEKA